MNPLKKHRKQPPLQRYTRYKRIQSMFFVADRMEERGETFDYVSLHPDGKVSVIGQRPKASPQASPAVGARWITAGHLAKDFTGR
jgi:hypothetical protein